MLVYIDIGVVCGIYTHVYFATGPFYKWLWALYFVWLNDKNFLSIVVAYLTQICCSDFDVGITVRINNEKEPETLKPTETKSEENIESHKNFNLLPETCGNIDGNRIIGGEVAKLYEFPWMALISYTKGVFGGNFLPTSKSSFIFL